MKVSQKDIKDYADHRQKMVETLLERGVKDLRVLDAMNRTPRHLFVPEVFRHKAYGDHPLPIGSNQTISQPYIVGLMTSLLNIDPEDRVLEIGTGSGYQTAVLAELAQTVFTLERLKEIGKGARKKLEGIGYHNVLYKIFDGTYGWPDQAPFDAVMVTAGAREIPATLAAQLKDGGRMAIPLGEKGVQRLILVTKTGDKLKTRAMSECRFVPLIGKFGW
tara:strand:- start:12089 stop:12745 length:657 start_codon:yes stop_codon:yes gene_type:complete